MGSLRKANVCRWALDVCLLLLSMSSFASTTQPIAPGEEVLVTRSEAGQPGGRIVVALRAEPKTLNPVTAIDQPSREVLGRMIGDLIHINRATQLTEPALAKSWKVSPDGRRYTLRLRRGIRFSDGQPFSADDVVFSFQAYLDEKINSPQRDLLVIGGKPISVRKLDAYTVEFEMAQPYAAAERLFDSVAILPRHVLEADHRAGKLAQDWGLNTAASGIVGLGPFRLKEYVPGQRLVLERNPYYWKADTKKTRLPYLDEVVFLFVNSEDAQVLRFTAGDTDLISRLSPDNFAVLEKEQAARGYRMYDLGPGLEFNFLFFNLNSVLPKNPELARKQKWFKDVAFRQAISSAIDRGGINKLVYRGRASVLATHVTPAYRSWVDASIPQPVRSIPKSRELLQRAGFKWAADGRLLDSSGNPVEFSVATSASNAQRTQMATIIQDDLKELGMKVNVVPLDFRSLLDRINQSHDYEAAVLALTGGGDVDPTPQMNVWVSNGSTHLWDLGETKPATPWEAEIDRLMNQQLITLDPRERRKLYDRVQEIVAEQLPLICLVSPHILVGARTRIGNFQPSILDHYTLWNADELYWKAR